MISLDARGPQKSDLGELSVVIPIHNEEGNLPALHRRLVDTLNHAHFAYEIVYVDDGSQDASLALLRSFARSVRVRVLSLSRNFGHQAAITAGLEHARGAAVVTMDGDLQDPPELIPQLVTKWRAGYEVVAARRVARDGEMFLRKLLIRLYYRLLQRIADHPTAVDVGDYRLVDRRIVDVLNGLPEKQKYLRGLVSWAGFRQASVPYTRPARLSGRSKFTYAKLFALALHGLTSSAKWPLEASAYLGVTAACLGGLSGGYAVINALTGLHVVPAWVPGVAALLLLCGLQLIGIGLLGIYLGGVLEEVRARPAYLVAWDSGAEVARSDEPLAVATS